MSVAAGKSEQRILQKLQLLSSKQQNVERHQAANQLPAAAGGGASDPSTGDTTADIIIISSNLPQQTPQAPPTSVSAPPTTVLAHTPVQTFVQQPQTSSQTVLQVSKPTLAPPGVSHNAPVLQGRQRTVPNILSRSKNPAPRSILSKTTVEGKTEEPQDGNSQTNSCSDLMTDPLTHLADLLMNW